MAKSVKKINPMVEDVIKRAEKELGNKFVQVEENLWQLRKVKNMEWKPEYGTHHDRDFNASKNILKKALEQKLSA